jgi:K+-transporting ATPase KdpF subunit
MPAAVSRRLPGGTVIMNLAIMLNFTATVTPFLFVYLFTALVRPERF